MVWIRWPQQVLVHVIGQTGRTAARWLRLPVCRLSDALDGDAYSTVQFTAATAAGAEDRESFLWHACRVESSDDFGFGNHHF